MPFSRGGVPYAGLPYVGFHRVDIQRWKWGCGEDIMIFKVLKTYNIKLYYNNTFNYIGR
jgi:hypothetical protein